MGCASSTNVHGQMGKSEKTIKAALLIQRWYRRYVARLETRRRATWSIFQTIEYAGEQDQFKLYNFFNTMVEQFSMSGENHGTIMKAFSDIQHRNLSNSSAEEEETEESMLLSTCDPDLFPVEIAYCGPRLTFPITRQQIRDLISAFKDNQTLHTHYLLRLLLEARRVLRTLPNINRISSSLSGQVTVCGDLHGKLDDLYMIFQKNGMPSVDNPYVFNGDFVDRGPHSVEIMCLLLSCLVLSPTEVYLNRGNHEDHTMNMRYGFTKEVMRKYKRNAMKVIKLFDEVFRWLPLASIIDSKVLVVHGGVSEHIDLNFIETIDRQKYISVLRPPIVVELEQSEGHMVDARELEEWKQILDLVWSDPRQAQGSAPNTFRGGGCYFGPDVTRSVLEAHGLSLMIRSHECKEEGFEYTHDGMLLTVFSASNYYDDNSNKGAFVKVSVDSGCIKAGNQQIQSPGSQQTKSLPDSGKPELRLMQFIARARNGRRLTFTERVSHLESSALRNVRNLILGTRSDLEAEFFKYDPDKTGMIQATQWCQAMETVMEIDVPWRLLRPRLVSSAVHTNGQQVLYESTFHDRRVSFRNMESGPSVTESLYRHKEVLETIFRTFDKDSSGCLSMAEFSEACQILTRHAGLSLQPEQISDIARSLDLNHDGHIDFNEFLEAFRIVESQERKGRAAMLFDIPEKEDGGQMQQNNKDGHGTPRRTQPKIAEEEEEDGEIQTKVSETVFKHLTPSLSSDSSNRHTDSIQVEICSEKDREVTSPSRALSTTSWVDVQRARVAQQTDGV